MENMITEIERVEQTLRNLTVVAEEATEAIVVADQNGNLRFVNTAWARMHGYANRAELVGKPISMFHTEEQFRNDVRGIIEETKHRGRLEGPIWHMRSDGTTFATHTKIIVLKNGQGNTVGLTVFVTETSAISQAEEVLRQRTAELKTANELLQNKIADCQRLQSELYQCHNQLKQQKAELSAVQEELQEQITERERVENESQEYCNGFEQQITELAAALNKVIRFAESGTHLVCHKA
jgi:PAS domain S-box-containing protein